ncbi:DUF4270 domain-containing protein [Sinomicrobium weinanense]|uniref:DUF4270 domain-containing protein n=1 Tax=Sinomicrobium weinanense TaxID=2842200 RepID=A0A926Q054_9FLAO|nr:DUF4270 domain-containing protein [Sinomicrobium weinanense]MBC9794558.1 DUF4270 domain-containing protein [Sinomicrobium weinanense]MBU3124043.1 DUF4270 domain-containing protein [Sinomicrobium weinanense]
MKKVNFRLYKAILLLGGIAFFASCDNEVNTLGTDIIGGGNFETERVEFDVYAYNHKLSAVQTNGMPLYQLGVFNDPIYGKTEAGIVSQLYLATSTFGVVSQPKEEEYANDGKASTTPENEKVTKVYLNIPFFSRVADGETENNEDGNPVARKYDLDSIFGDKSAEFQLKVEELTYYLRDLDPSSGFVEQQEYFSDRDFSGHIGMILYDSVAKIDNKEILIYKEDDPDTDDVNEGDEVSQRLTPRIRVPLKNEFFQQILDKEGSDELLSSNNFKEFIKGLRFSAYNFSNDVLMLLDWNNANIQVEYQYDRVNTSNNNEIVKNNSSFSLSLAAFTINSNTGGRSKQNNVVNILTNDPYPSEIEGEMDTETNASRIYVKGGAGTLPELRLFDPPGDSTELKKVKGQGWIINDANLTFYIDREKLDALQGLTEPPRIYVYNLEDNKVLADVELDYTTSQDNNLAKQIFGGILEKEDDKGVRYKIRITEHINQILNEDAANVKLGLAVTANINYTNNVSAGAGENGDTELHVPEASVINPLGTILYGGGDMETGNEDKRLKLEIFYTKVD